MQQVLSSIWWCDFCLKGSCNPVIKDCLLIKAEALAINVTILLINSVNGNVNAWKTWDNAVAGLFCTTKKYDVSFEQLPVKMGVFFVILCYWKNMVMAPLIFLINFAC